MHLLTRTKNGTSTLELKRDLGVRYKTALLLKHKIMEVMRLREDSRQLYARIEVDDAYLGGEHAGGKPGPGSENKVSFVAEVQTTERGQPVLCCLAQIPFTKKALAKLPQFNAVNTVLGNLKTSFTGTFHAFDFAKYAHRYLGDFQFRFNRRFDLRRILPQLLAAAVTTPPKPRRVLVRGLTEVGH